MKTLFLFATLLTGISSCAFVKDFQKSSSINATLPKTPTDPLIITAKLWNMSDLAHKYAPQKLEDFITETEKYCTIKIVKLAQTPNDTTVIQLKCDTAAGKIAHLFKK